MCPRAWAGEREAGQRDRRVGMEVGLPKGHEVTPIPGGSDSKVSVCNSGDRGSIPGLGRSPGERNGSPLQYSCLENPMDSRAW